MRATAESPPATSLPETARPEMLLPARPAPAGPRLLPQPAPLPIKPYSLPELWHLLSLDAPSVAAVWTAFVARCAGVNLAWTSTAAMFVAVWMLYAADRLLDARPLPHGAVPSGLEDRHHFHQHHRRGFLVGIGVASTVLAALLAQLDPRSLRLYALLACFLGAWLLLVHSRSAVSLQHRRLPKEFAVGVFFPAAVFIPSVARLPGLRLALLPMAGLLAAVCTLNCLFVYAWEHPGEGRGALRPMHSTAHATTRWAVQHLSLLPGLIGAMALGVAWTTRAPGPLPGRASALGLLALACALSSLLLFALDQLHRHLQLLTLRVLADAVLLTPILGWLYDGGWTSLLRNLGHR